MALLARELLSETGSFFMQIGDVNVHRCAMVLDEVFGPENRVSTIMYATGGGGSSTRSIAEGWGLHPVVRKGRHGTHAVPGFVRGPEHRGMVRHADLRIWGGPPGRLKPSSEG